jgi:hypothetical protein
LTVSFHCGKHHADCAAALLEKLANWHFASAAYNA